MDLKELHVSKTFTQWRPGQEETVGKILDSFDLGKPFFFLDAPCGTGKSLIAMATATIINDCEAVMDRMTDNEGFKPRVIYVTHTKQLQDQLLKDFPQARTVKGRANYPCALKPEKFPEITAEDCYSSSDCPKKDECPYLRAKYAAVNAPVSVLNYSYFLREVNSSGMFRDAELIIFDEVDCLESALMNYIKFSISSKQLKKLNIAPPNLEEGDDFFQVWTKWAQKALDYCILAQRMGMLEIEDRSEKGKKLKGYKELENELNNFLRDVRQDWIYSVKKDEAGNTTWTFKPIFLSNFLQYFYCGKRVLGMSGTILDPKTMASNLGIPSYEYLQVKSPFPKENRPIHYVPAANLIRKEMQDELPKLEAAITKIMELYPNDKILVHTTSYPVRDYLQFRLDPFRVITHNPTDREQQLKLFQLSKKPLVMLSPSFDRGVDLPGDMCRVIVVAKIPYIDMSDEQVRARMDASDGDRWYLMHTTQTLLQMTGRGMRSSDDYCRTFILDKQFNKLFRRVHYLFPDWWKEAITNKINTECLNKADKPPIVSFVSHEMQK